MVFNGIQWYSMVFEWYIFVRELKNLLVLQLAPVSPIPLLFKYYYSIEQEFITLCCLFVTLTGTFYIKNRFLSVVTGVANMLDRSMFR